MKTSKMKSHYPLQNCSQTLRMTSKCPKMTLTYTYDLDTKTHPTFFSKIYTVSQKNMDPFHFSKTLGNTVQF